jgi:putative ABC transport system ATP-binding protein
VIRIEGLVKIFHRGSVNENVALSGVDLHVSDGDFVTVIGSNGAGKSTALNAVAGTWPLDAGTIRSRREKPLPRCGTQQNPDTDVMH